jgi:hypothetical protein
MLVCSIFFAGGVACNAQTVILAHDTINVVASGSSIETYYDTVSNLTATAADIQWKVISTNFPTDWRNASVFCDPDACYGDFHMWPAIPTKNFTLGTGDDLFNLGIDYSVVTSTGCFYATVRMNNLSVVTDTATVTYIICGHPVSVPTVKVADEVAIYPNPVTTALNVKFDATLDVKNVAIYSIIGRQLSLYRVAGSNCASLNVEHIPSGVYFLRLMNSRGDVVTTRKFTKQ